MANSSRNLRAEEDVLFFDWIRQFRDLVAAAPLDAELLPVSLDGQPETAIRRYFDERALEAITQVFADLIHGRPMDSIRFDLHHDLVRMWNGNISAQDARQALIRQAYVTTEAIESGKRLGSMPVFMRELMDATDSKSFEKLKSAWDKILECTGYLHLGTLSLHAVRKAGGMRATFARHAGNLAECAHPETSPSAQSAFQVASGSSHDRLRSIAQKLETINFPGNIQEVVLTELRQISQMPPTQNEFNLGLSFLDRLAALPWGKPSVPAIDIGKVRGILDENHFGMDAVKTAIVQLLAVQQLSGKTNGTILCLAGPPGIGKTSLGASIARATGRQFQRIALGGIADASEIRGHRRTYTNSMPGKIMEAIKKAGTVHAVFMLDEVDKLTAGSPQGDPQAALLEVLDPEQNDAFHDSYFGIPYDLSGILFICTANDPDNIPGPLKDRMKVIQLDGYTRSQKFHIARQHLVPKLIKAVGFKDGQVSITDDAIGEVIGHCVEPGVRNMERAIKDICAAAAVEVASGASEVRITAENIGSYYTIPPVYDTLSREDQVGSVNGLTASSRGGKVLPIETVVMPGNNFDIAATGNLKLVIKESISVAHSWVLRNAAALGIDVAELNKKQVHIHAGSTPKDGPSAGVTALASIVSALTNIPARADTAMTGEIGLLGQVLPIGGLDQKLEAASAAGIKRVIVPESNRHDVDSLPAGTLEDLGLEIIYVRTVREVLEHALTANPWKISAPALTLPTTGLITADATIPSVQAPAFAAISGPG